MPPSVELDHVFILCDSGAPEASALLALGLREGSANTHPGQGTACRRFFFRNAYLELLWVADAAEAQREPAGATRLFERWAGRQSGRSPFGIVFRPASAVASPADPPHPVRARPPFPTWAYRPPYLPSGLAIELATGTTLTEPELFYIPLHRSPALSREPAAHGLPLSDISRVTVTVPAAAPPSPAGRAAEAAGLLSFASGDAHGLELTFDGGVANRSADLRPALPLSLRW